MDGVDALVEATTRWYLTWDARGATSRTTIAAGRDGFARLAGAARRLGSDERRAARARRRPSGSSRRACPSELARAHACLRRAAARARHRRRRRARPGARSRTSRAVFFAARRPSCGSTGSRRELDALPGAARACSAGRSRPCARTLWRARRELAAARSPTRPARRPRTPSSASSRPIPTRCGASPTSRARWRARATRPRRPHARGPPAARARELKPRSRGSRARTTKPRPIGPARSSPPHSATRSRMPISPCPPLASPWAAAAAGDAVGDLDLEHLRRPAQDDPRPAAAAVLERVGQALLHEAEGGQVDAGRQRPGQPLDAQLDVEPGVARAGDERVEAIERGLRGVVGVLAVGAQDAEQAAHLGQRLAAGGLDRAQRADRGVGVAVEHAARRAGLHDHDRDRVRDDVVQLARDPHALARHGVALALGALALELLGARPQLGGQARAAAADAAQRPAARRRARRGRSTSPTARWGPSAVTTTTSAQHAGESGLRAAAGQVRADREGEDRDEDRGRGEVLGMRVRQRRARRRPRRRSRPAPRAARCCATPSLAARTAPSSRAGTSGVSRTDESASSSSMSTPRAAASARSKRRGRGIVTSPAPRWAAARAARSRAAGGGRRAARRRRGPRARAG